MHPSYRMSVLRKFRLGLRMFVNTLRIESGSSYKGHLAMALKLLELPPTIVGDVIECGTWKGASAANLSLVCKIVSRRLLIYDSFQGLPSGTPGDREAVYYQEGDYRGTLDEVRRNVRRYGAIDSVEFVPGWFNETLPHLRGPIVLAWLDVDLEASLETCIRHIWPVLVDQGYIFTDEATTLDDVALFWSERWWETHFQRTPPGLIGLGTFYAGPFAAMRTHPLQHGGTAAYTSKSMSGHWTLYQDELTPCDDRDPASLQ